MRVVIFTISLLIWGCSSDSGSSKKDTKETQSTSPDENTVLAGSLAFITVDDAPYLDDSSSLNNVRVVTDDNKLAPLENYMTLNINQAESTSLAGQQFDVSSTKINPFTQDIYFVLNHPVASKTGGEVDCWLLKVKNGEKVSKCVALGASVESFYDHDRSQYFELSELHDLKFDEGGAVYFLGYPNGQQPESSFKSLYKLGNDENLTMIADESEFIHGFDVNRAGVVFVWGDADPFYPDFSKKSDEKFISIYKTDGTKVTKVTLPNINPEDSNVMITRILFFTVDIWDGLIYAPEQDARSDHFIYKLTFDKDFKIDQTVALSKVSDSDLNTEISWPFLAKKDKDGRVFGLASPSGYGDPFPGEDINVEPIFHLYQFNLSQGSDGNFSSTKKVITGFNENVEAYEVIDSWIYYYGNIRDTSDRFFRKRPVGGGNFKVLQMMLMLLEK